MQIGDNMSNIVYIATSLDGFIADKKGGLEWLSAVSNPTADDLGYKDFLGNIDAILMGRITYETVLEFGIGWPYKKPVFVLSNTLKKVPVELTDKVQIVNGQLKTIIAELNCKGFDNLYIDGGKTVQSFLYKGLVDEIIITIIPILLGGGASLFGELPNHIQLKLKKSQVFLDSIVQNHYLVNR
mgnify:CR=1 FL=1